MYTRSVKIHVFLLLPALAAQAQQPRNLDLFLLIGQSNMAGRGAVEAQDTEPIPRVYMLTKELDWKPAADPMHFDKPAIIGVGIGRSFAKVLLKANPSASIGLIPSAFGGSSLEEWNPGGKLYADALSRARAAMKSGMLRGILWRQGEADSSGDGLARSYGDRWKRLIGSLREDLGAGKVPVIVGQLGEFFARPSARIVNEQLATLPLTAARTGFVSSAGLNHKGDNVHFDTPSLREFGRRYGLAYLMLDAGWSKD